MTALVDAARAVFRRSFRVALTLPGARPLRRLAWRLPFTRFHRWVPRLFRGQVVTTMRGVSILVDPGEVHGYYPYFLGDYSSQELDKLLELLAEQRLFMDLGAHSGMFSLIAARRFPDLRVIAFEPDPENADRFRQNLRLNPDLEGRIELYEVAVADQEGRAPFSFAGEGPNTGTARLVTGRPPSDRDVAVTTLDAFCKPYRERPDVLKIDVEGAEDRVLRGMAGLHPAPRAILLETHGFHHARELRASFNQTLVSLLLERGYAIRRLDGQVWEPLQDSEQLGGRSHLLAVRSSDEWDRPAP